jgi:hypothetical protein
MRCQDRGKFHVFLILADRAPVVNNLRQNIVDEEISIEALPWIQKK